MSRQRMPRPVPILEGTMVLLRPLDPDRDAQDYYEWNLDPEMHVWTGNAPFDSVDAAREELVRFAQMQDVTMWAIEDRQTHRMVGRFFVCIENRDGRLIAGEGNRIARACWRKGHNREARRLIFDYVFNALGADAIESECWTANVNSRLSLLAHGFRLVGESTEYNSNHQQPMPKSHFLLERGDWKRR
ncbi:MAG: GNAT family N-acetyltransferase [Planctomycetes bacterium]|nr:GNAT family N-acetyltransferase [Planctomycetota bacterium]